MKYTQPDPEFIKQAFDSITPNYDRLNQILSFGMSETWRKQSAEIVLKIPDFSPQSILDLGCGTGKFLECFLRRRELQVSASVPEASGSDARRRELQVSASVPEASGPDAQRPVFEYAVGLDFSSAMLKKARDTISDRVLWIEDDFSKPPFLESSFDLIISGFTLRSVQNLPEFLGQVYRILKPSGRVAFLELTRPRSLVARAFFYPYLKFVLPLMGWMISGDSKAYKFLSQSVRNFQTPEKTLETMKRTGFRALSSKSFAFGAATLMIGQKVTSKS